MKKGITTLEFLIGLIIGILILLALLYPSRLFASLLFGRSQACLDDQTKSSVDLVAKDLEFLKDNKESSSIINLNGEDCAFFVWDKQTASDITPPPEIFNKNIALCVCKLSDNECVGGFYCQDETTSDILKTFNSIGFDGFEGKRYILSSKKRFSDTIFYMKVGDKIIFSKESFQEEYGDDVPITSQEDLENIQVKSSEEYKPYIKKAHEMYPDVPESLIKAIVQQESGYNQFALSYVGAAGPMQIMPSLAIQLGLYVPEGYATEDTNVDCWSNKRQIYYFRSDSRSPPRLVSKCNKCYIKDIGYAYKDYCDYLRDERFNIEKAISAGTKHLSDLLKNPLVNGDYELAAAAYNAGLGALKQSKYCSKQMIWECQINKGYQQTRDYVIKVAQYQQAYETATA